MEALAAAELPGDLAERAETAALVAAQHASAVDSASRFPAEAFDAIRAQRLLGVLVPRALGGEGASIATVADLCYRLAQGCSATGMIFAMHQIMVACLLRHRGRSQALERLLHRLCAEQWLLASSTTEGQRGGDVRASEAAVQTQDGRIRLERAATVISYGAHADGIVTTARRAPDAEASDQVLVAFAKGDYTLSRLHGWNAMGMRGTCSEGYMLRATGTPEQVLPEPYEAIHARTMVPCAHLLWGSVWAGIATGATARAQAFLRQAARRTGGQLPPGAPQLTRALTTLQTLRGMLAHAIERYERCMDDAQALSSLDFQSMITITKVEASELAVAVVLAALRACGLSGYRCDGEFSVERHLRDVLSSPIMINNERILANLAGSALMTPLPDSVRG